MRRVILLIGAFSILIGCSSLKDDRQAIANSLHRVADRPSAPLDINPIVVRERYAIAGWTQGESGGRTLLRREHGEWKIVVQAGEELRDVQFLKHAGVPQQEAQALVNVLIAAERRVQGSRLALFDRYGENNLRR